MQPPEPRIGIDPNWRDLAPYGCSCTSETRRVRGCRCHHDDDRDLPLEHDDDR